MPNHANDVNKENNKKNHNSTFLYIKQTAKSHNS